MEYRIPINPDNKLNGNPHIPITPELSSSPEDDFYLSQGSMCYQYIPT